MTSIRERAHSPRPAPTASRAYLRKKFSEFRVKTKKILPAFWPKLQLAKERTKLRSHRSEG
jgi:hypothetical protein